jgi:hypothetical protein
MADGSCEVDSYCEIYLETILLKQLASIEMAMDIDRFMHYKSRYGCL